MIRYISATLLPGNTLDALMRYYGRHDLTKAEMAILRDQFNTLNGAIVPKAGMTVKIPLPTELVPGSAAHSLKIEETEGE